ncbi:RNA polymerase sigma factor [Patulibacter sp. NPDC049589]|uniref:RNA polymerase sigma factor n=1 Tax=Patulibacter sp. NPDC049589 TaxID=3154731 RepID=UPI00341AF567
MWSGGDDRRSDEQLLVAAASGTDPEAFGVFYRRHAEAILAYLLRRTRRPELAADVCAETFAHLLGRLDRYDPDRGAARGWLFRVAQNQLIDAARRGQVEDRARRRLGIDPIALTDADVEAVSELRDRADLVAPLLEALPDDQREALEARVVQERDYEEIARTLRVSESVVRKRVSRGLSSLRAQMTGGDR